MSVEVLCPSCGKGYVLDERQFLSGGGSFPCQSCDATITLGPLPGPSPQDWRAKEVCCPRCGLHFVADADAVDATTGTRRTILLVEDLEYFVEIARDALGGLYEVRTARTVDEAKVVLLRGGIDLMLLDLTLAGGEDGLRVLREPPGKVCPVLAFTAQDETDMYGDGWTKLRNSGVDDMVIKGINMGELLVRKVAALMGEPSTPDKIYR